MKPHLKLFIVKNLLFPFFLILIFFSPQISKAASYDYYAIKIYHLKDQSQAERVEKYLKDAYLPAMHRAGIKTVGVFKPIDESADAGLSVLSGSP